MSTTRTTQRRPPRRFRVYVEFGTCPQCRQTKVRVDGEEDVNNCDCVGEMQNTKGVYVTLPRVIVTTIIAAWAKGDDL